MADDVTLYAQFDGDEIDGTRYALGDEVKGLDAGTRDYLVGIGRLSAAPPAKAETPIEEVAPPAGKPLASMTTAELTDTAMREGVAFGDDVKTNADRAAAIQAARDAKSS